MSDFNIGSDRLTLTEVRPTLPESDKVVQSCSKLIKVVTSWDKLMPQDEILPNCEEGAHACPWSGLLHIQSV